MGNDIQFHSFFQRLDFMSTQFCRCPFAWYPEPCPTPYIWIILNWQIVSTEGLLDALCSYIASKHNAVSCTLVVSSIVEERHLAVFYKGLQQVAETLGNIPSLKHLRLIHCWINCNVINKWRYCACKKGCKGFSYDKKRNVTKVDFRVEAVVLQHVRQLTEFQSRPRPSFMTNPPIASCNVEELAKALRDHPLLTSFAIYFEQDQKTLNKALLSMPKLSKLFVYFSFFTTEFVAKESMRELTIDTFAFQDEVTTARQWAALCSALGRKSAKLTLLNVYVGKLPSYGEFYAELGRALLTNESLETLSVFTWDSVLLPRHGVALALALVNHPRLLELQLGAPLGLSPEDYEVWQELFCNGIAQMKSLRRLKLYGFFWWTTSMVQALQRLVPSLSDLTIGWINTAEEWFDVASCVIYGRRLTTLSITSCTNIEQNHEDLLAGVMAMNQAGRQYVLNDAMNKRKAIVVLVSVTDNLDCLYIHLRESPCF